MSKKRRPSRAKPWSAADLARLDTDLAHVTEKENPYWEDVRPMVDREALLRAVTYPQFDTILAEEGKRRGLSLEDEWRWSRLCRIRAAMRELAAMEQELGDATPKARPDDPRNKIPVPKIALWRLVHPGQEPEQQNTASRWYANKVFPIADPTPHDPTSREHVTINLRLFAERFGLPLEAVQKALR